MDVIDLETHADVFVDTTTHINGTVVNLEDFVSQVRLLVLAAQDVLPRFTIDDNSETAALRKSLEPFIARHR
jgi:hypothetical protein